MHMYIYIYIYNNLLIDKSSVILERVSLYLT